MAKKKPNPDCMDTLPDPDVGCEWVFKGPGFLSRSQMKFAFLPDGSTRWNVDNTGFPGGMENGVYAIQQQIPFYQDIADVPKALLQKYIDGVWQCKVPPVCTAQWDTLAWVNWINRNGVWKAHNRRSHEVLRGGPSLHGLPLSPRTVSDAQPVALTEGHTLFTKDGRVTGNAIVLRQIPDANNPTLYELETDFGNVVKNTLGEIQEKWWLTDTTGAAQVQDVDKWKQDRQLLRLKANA